MTLGLGVLPGGTLGFMPGVIVSTQVPPSAIVPQLAGPEVGTEAIVVPVGNDGVMV